MPYAAIVEMSKCVQVPGPIIPACRAASRRPCGPASSARRSCSSGSARNPRQNGLALALREIGRIERTLFTLDWLEQPSLRRQATAELTKGESCNALSRAVCFHRLGRLRDRTAEAQQHRASGLALVTAAIALWNTVYLGRALDALRQRGSRRLRAMTGMR